MPSHQDRINKLYEDLCVKCLKRLNNNWNDEDSFPNFCEVCKWLRYLRDGVTHSIPSSIIDKMTPEEKATLND